RRFPLDILKIDQAFIHNVGTQSEDGAIVRAIITMAHELGMKVVAEGVETKEHYRFLEQERCDIVQGYLISRPVTAEAMEQLLREQALAERQQPSFLSGI
ncbi:MAG: EAL domain-containing protein, partial [Paraperlucidibaca sp.]